VGDIASVGVLCLLILDIASVGVLCLLILGYVELLNYDV
jgi:hypothetical protein